MISVEGDEAHLRKYLNKVMKLKDMRLSHSAVFPISPWLALHSCILQSTDRLSSAVIFFVVSHVALVKIVLWYHLAMQPVRIGYRPSTGRITICSLQNFISMLMEGYYKDGAMSPLCKYCNQNFPLSRMLGCLNVFVWSGISEETL